MQISKVYKKRIISAIVLLTMLAGMSYIIGYLLKPVHYGVEFYNAEIEEMKEQKTKVDMVFIGNSRVLRSCNPKIFEEKLCLNRAFHLSFNQADLEGVYFQLKDFIEEFHPKTVVLGITHNMLTDNSTPIIVKLRMLERLHGSNKIEYIKNCFSINEYPYIFPLYGYRKGIFNIKRNVLLRVKFYKEGIKMGTKKWQSMGRGFIVREYSVPLGNMGIKKKYSFDEIVINEKAIGYLDKCIQLCKFHNIQLFLMTPPTSMADIYIKKNYQTEINYIEGYARNNNIIYHNLSYLKGREEWLTDSMLYDYIHLNKEGSAVLSEKYAEILSKDMNNINTGDYFYPTLTEMKKSVNRIVAVDSVPVIKETKMTLSIQSLQNQGVTPHYQVLLAKQNNEFKTVVNWTSEKNISFNIPKGDKYRVLLRARHTENDTYYAWVAWEVNEEGAIRKIHDVPVSNM